MVEVNKLTCPGCGASVDYSEEKDLYYCAHCGSKIDVDDDNKKRIEIVRKTDRPTIACDYCSGTIFLDSEKKFKCIQCGRTVCSSCYSEALNLCKACFLDKQKEEASRNKAVNFIIAGIIIFVFVVAVICCYIKF